MAIAANNNNNNDLDFFGEESDQDRNGASLVEQIDIQHYLRIIRKHKWPISLFTGAVTALAIYYAYTATPIYAATSTLLIEQQKANVPTIEELYGVDTQNTDYYQTQFELLKSRSLARKVIDKLDLWNSPELSAAAREAQAQHQAGLRDAIGVDVPVDDSMLGKVKSFFSSFTESVSGSVETVDSTSVELVAESGENTSSPIVLGEELSQIAEQSVIGNFMGRLTISPIRKTKLVKITYESDDPEHAANVANTVGVEYINSYLEGKIERTTNASLFLNERLATLKQTLDESKERLITFKEQNGLVDVDGSVNRLNEQKLLLLTSELAQARSALSDTNSIYREVRSLRGNPELLETVPGVQADPLVQRVKIEQGVAQRALDELLNRYGERHPRVIDAKSQLNTLNNSLQGHVRRVVNSIEKDYQLSRQRVASIEAKLAEGKQSIQALGSKKFELDALDREVVTNQEIYDKFFNTISEAKSADGLETANARISDFAVAPVGPIKPKKQLIIALAALASLVLSMLMAFLYEQMDDTIKSTNDVEAKLGEKLLGILPLIKGGIFKRQQALPLNPLDFPDKQNRFAEAVSTARTALCMDDQNGTRKVVVVTSSVPGEGKSTASINLAYSLSQLERVLLIDCDMRRPTIAKAIGLEKNAPGLSSLIVNTATARECIHRGAFDGAVDILPSGPVPDQPLELLSSKRFAKILEQLRGHYDRIVIDSAPTQAVSDALVLSKVADSVVYVVKSHDTSLELVKRGLQRLKQVNARIAGVLITQVDIDKITSYGGDYYYQGYYDYYGYTEKGERGKRPGKIRLTPEELIKIKNDDSDVDLGMEFGGNGSTNGAVRANGKHAKVPASQQDYDEFDLTTQIDMPPKATERPAGSKTGRDRSRFIDDLDII